MQNDTTWTITDAEVQIGNDARFWHCDVDVVIRTDVEPIGVAMKDITGEIEFTHPVPNSMLFDEDGCPVVMDVVAETDSEELTIDGLLCSGPAENTIQFHAQDATLTVEEQPDDEERIVELISDLLAELRD